MISLRARVRAVGRCVGVEASGCLSVGSASFRVAARRAPAMPPQARVPCRPGLLLSLCHFCWFSGCRVFVGQLRPWGVSDGLFLAPTPPYAFFRSFSLFLFLFPKEKKRRAAVVRNFFWSVLPLCRSRSFAAQRRERREREQSPKRSAPVSFQTKKRDWTTGHKQEAKQIMKKEKIVKKMGKNWEKEKQTTTAHAHSFFVVVAAAHRAVPVRARADISQCRPRGQPAGRTRKKEAGAADAAPTTKRRPTPKARTHAGVEKKDKTTRARTVLGFSILYFFQFLLDDEGAASRKRAADATPTGAFSKASETHRQVRAANGDNHHGAAAAQDQRAMGRGHADAPWMCRRCARRPHDGDRPYTTAAAATATDGQRRHTTTNHNYNNGNNNDNNTNVNEDTAVFDYIVVGLGAAGSACARALSDDPTVSVLALDWGPDRRADPTATDLLRGADAAHDPGTSIRVGGAAEPGLLGARCALGGGRAVGGSTLVDSALWGTGGTREWRDFAKACARAGPRHAGADVWLQRVAAAASIPLARVEAYDGLQDAPIGGAPSSSSTAASATVPGLPSAYRRRPWDPGGYDNGFDCNGFVHGNPDQKHGWRQDGRHGGMDSRHHHYGGNLWDGGVHHGGRNSRRDGNGDVYRDATRGEYDDGDDGDNDAPDCPTRGTHGRVAVRALPPAWDALSDSFARAAGRVYGVREVADHNGPAEFGVARRVQFAVGLGPPHGFNRQPAGDAFVGHSTEKDRCALCRRRRRLTVVGGALVERVVFGPVPSDHPTRGSEARPRALGVIYLERGTKAVRAHARRRVVLCASALTPALLQRSGIGDPRLIAGIGTRLVFANAAVGSGYHCPYGFRMVASVVAQSDGVMPATGLGRGPPDVRSDLNPPGTVGIVLAQDSTRPTRRRRQWCVLAAAGPLPDYWPVAGDPLVRAASRWEPFGAAPPSMSAAALHDAANPGAAATATTTAVISLSAWLLDPTSRGGGIETPSADPSVLPRARLGLYTDPADMRSMRALARSVARLIDAMAPTPDGHRLALAHPRPRLLPTTPCSTSGCAPRPFTWRTDTVACAVWVHRPLPVAVAHARPAWSMVSCACTALTACRYATRPCLTTAWGRARRQARRPCWPRPMPTCF
ncbi:GMC oxidoreductase [Pandoravirus inopinatum]|uniref:GMC oxidoreductase n=1 Tax=Pandoravirus inopinatum TaxID=1605721 RepID=A0A0B5JEW7_9VIRU|nr:GMC oxidoreductase [Pandoravirus inopinatum]AJF98352.1 GMC oxidoreductase [Pandoravirus inopinatum]